MMRMEFRVTSGQAQRAMARAPQLLRERIGQALRSGAERLAREAARRAPKWRTHLANDIVVTRLGELHYRVSAGTNYARPIEDGVDGPLPRMPGTSRGLMDWVREVLRPPEKELEHVTFAVARSMQRHGIRPQPYMRPAKEATEAQIGLMVRAATARAAQEINRGP